MQRIHILACLCIKKAILGEKVNKYFNFSMAWGNVDILATLKGPGGFGDKSSNKSEEHIILLLEFSCQSNAIYWIYFSFKQDEGWLYGENISSRKRGAFPANHSKRVEL